MRPVLARPEGPITLGTIPFRSEGTVTMLPVLSGPESIPVASRRRSTRRGRPPFAVSRLLRCRSPLRAIAAGTPGFERTIALRSEGPALPVWRLHRVGPIAVRSITARARRTTGDRTILGRTRRSRLAFGTVPRDVAFAAFAPRAFREAGALHITRHLEPIARVLMLAPRPPIFSATITATAVFLAQ